MRWALIVLYLIDGNPAMRGTTGMQDQPGLADGLGECVEQVDNAVEEVFRYQQPGERIEMIFAGCVQQGHANAIIRQYGMSFSVGEEQRK
jgi:hypothetical protein